MEHERYKRKTDYTKPAKRPQAPVLDELGELRVPSAASAASEATQATDNVPVEVTPKPEAVIPPEPATPQTTVAPTAKAVATPTDDGTTPVTISFNISMPKVKLHKPKVPKLSFSKLKTTLLHFGKWPLIAAGAIILLLIGFVIFKHVHHPAPQAASLAGGQVLADSALAKPSFTPVQATSKPTHTAFDGTKDSYSYTDYISGTALTVSEQPLPKQFSSATQAVSSVAKSLGANTLLPTTANSAYMATDAKSGTQTIVLSRNDILVFIQSYFAHSNAVWEQYIDSLH